MRVRIAHLTLEAFFHFVTGLGAAFFVSALVAAEAIGIAGARGFAEIGIGMLVG